MKNNKAIFIILIFLPSLTGCWGITLKPNTPKKYIEIGDIIESMYGSTQEEIIRELGEPGDIVKRDGPTYFIYQWRRSEKDIVFFILPVPVAGGFADTHLYCLFLEFDEANRLIRHASEERVFRNSDPWKSLKIDCIAIFYPSLLLEQ